MIGLGCEEGSVAQSEIGLVDVVPCGQRSIIKGSGSVKTFSANFEGIIIAFEQNPRRASITQGQILRRGEWIRETSADDVRKMYAPIRNDVDQGS